MRVCFRASVQPSLIGEYRRRHAAVWPEMLGALKDAGWNNYSLFLDEDGLLIGYVECDDFDAVRARMALADVNARWQAEMSSLFDNRDNPEQAPDEGFQVLEEVFNLDDQLAAAESRPAELPRLQQRGHSTTPKHAAAHPKLGNTDTGRIPS